MYTALETPVELTVVVLNDVENPVVVEVVEVVVVKVLVEVYDVKMDVDVAPSAITMLVKPESPPFPSTSTSYVPAGGPGLGTRKEPVIVPLLGLVNEQVPENGVGVCTVIEHRLSVGLKPDPLTVTKNPGPVEVGETETVMNCNPVYVPQPLIVPAIVVNVQLAVNVAILVTGRDVVPELGLLLESPP